MICTNEKFKHHETDYFTAAILLFSVVKPMHGPGNKRNGRSYWRIRRKNTMP